MPTLTIKGMPQALYRRLKQQAEAHRRSLNGEIIRCLERSVGAARLDPQDFLSQAASLQQQIRRPLTRRELRAARDDSRP